MALREKAGSIPSRAIERQARELVSRLDMLMRRMPMPKMDLALAPQDVKALALLGDKGALTMSELAEALGVPLSTASHKVERLVAKGIAERSRVEGDRRIVQVELSKQGKEASRVFRAHRLSVGRSMLAALSRGEREIFLELMEKIAREAKPYPDQQRD